MNRLFTCEIHYFPSKHLSHLYDGFEKLRKLGIIDITVKSILADAKKPLLTVKLNNKYTVIYDTLDGLNWIEGSIEDNLHYFQNTIRADFYFKRSFNELVLQHAPLNCQVYPLGLNFYVKSEDKFAKNLKMRLLDLIKSIKKPLFKISDFEGYPILNKENKILFLARLWNPDDVSLEALKAEREAMNENRINYIKRCQQEFGKHFLGGLQRDSFSIHQAKELIAPPSLTKKENFLNFIKQHAICVATNGLHHSIGWKLGEYVTASRAIVSEPLHYDLPGDFKQNKNYFSFTNEDELLNKIYFLLKNKDAMMEMMMSNFYYYNNYLRPENLVLNTLLKISETCSSHRRCERSEAIQKQF